MDYLIKEFAGEDFTRQRKMIIAYRDNLYKIKFETGGSYYYPPTNEIALGSFRPGTARHEFGHFIDYKAG